MVVFSRFRLDFSEIHLVYCSPWFQPDNNGTPRVVRSFEKYLTLNPVKSIAKRDKISSYLSS
jgi:hypothetical protein